MTKCDFCRTDCDGSLVLRDSSIEKEDGSDVVVCGECLDLYGAEEWEKLTERVNNEIQITN